MSQYTILSFEKFLENYFEFSEFFDRGFTLLRYLRILCVTLDILRELPKTKLIYFVNLLIPLSS